VWNKIYPKISQIEVKNWEKPLIMRDKVLPRVPKEKIYSKFVESKYKIFAGETIESKISSPEEFYETSDFLAGDIVMSIVYVQYDKEEWWPYDEVIYSFINVTEGVLWLNYTCPYPGLIGRINVTGNFAVIDVDPTSYSPEDSEIWISKVMGDLGYDPSIYGVYQYINELRTEYSASWGFIIFMVRGSQFNGGVPAFAHHWGPFEAIAVHEEPGWGYIWLLPAAAHETAHVFGADDEYCDPGYSCCRCDSNENFYQIPNIKCEAGCYLGYEDNCNKCIWGNYCETDNDCKIDEYCSYNRCKNRCLMNYPWIFPSLDPVSQAQVGWVDCNSDGIFVMGLDCINNVCQVGDYKVCGTTFCFSYTGSEVCRGKLTDFSWCDSTTKKSCSSSCQYRYQNCRIDAYDNDGSNYKTYGYCIDYQGCSGGSCISTRYNDQCVGNYVKEAVISGSSCTYLSSYNCKNYGSNYYCSGGACTLQMGGCPVLKAWDGNEYKDIEKLNIHSPEGIDTKYTTKFTMGPKDGKYYVKLSEIWYALMEGSHIDSVKLVDESGKECKLVSAVHDKKGDVISAITKSDDVRVETKPGEEIDLTFDGCSGKTFTFTVEGYNARLVLIKEALSSTNLIVIVITIIIVIVIVYSFFKLFAKNK
jgi:hypothetical protein